MKFYSKAQVEQYLQKIEEDGTELLNEPLTLELDNKGKNRTDTCSHA